LRTPFLTEQKAATKELPLPIRITQWPHSDVTPLLMRPLGYLPSLVVLQSPLYVASCQTFPFLPSESSPPLQPAHQSHDVSRSLAGSPNLFFRWFSSSPAASSSENFCIAILSVSFKAVAGQRLIRYWTHSSIPFDYSPSP